jgi:type VI secretion system protein VasJ
MPTYREEVAARLAPLLAPIEGPSPAGADVSYDADFEAIKAEIDKLSSVDNSEPAWSKIQTIGSSLLAKKGKDLRAASWMAVALVKTQSWPGFAEALVLYDGLLKAYWETMYPEARRARARVNAFAWMADMIYQHLLPKDVTLAEADAIRTCDEVLKEVDQLLADKLGDTYTGPGMLRSLMRDKVRAIPEPPPEAPAVVASAAVAAPAMVTTTAAAAPAGPAAPTSAGDVPSALVPFERVIMDAAALLRTADPTRAWGYKLQRLGAWLTVEEAPAVQDGRSFLPAPDD